MKDLIDELKRQVADELKEIEPNKSTEIMLQQKYGLLRPLFDEQELKIVNS